MEGSLFSSHHRPLLPPPFFLSPNSARLPTALVQAAPPHSQPPHRLYRPTAQVHIHYPPNPTNSSLINSQNLLILGSSPPGATLLNCKVGWHRVGGEAGGEGAEGGRRRGEGGQFRVRRTQGGKIPSKMEEATQCTQKWVDLTDWILLRKLVL